MEFLCNADCGPVYSPVERPDGAIRCNRYYASLLRAQHAAFRENREALCRVQLAAALDHSRRWLWPHARPRARPLPPPHHFKPDNDCQPVHIVPNHTAIRGAVLPAENGVEDAPPPAAGRVFWAAAVDVPHALADIVRAWTGSRLSCVTAGYLVPRVLLEVPDAAREETSGHEVEDAGGGNEKDLERGCETAAVDDIADGQSSRQTDDDSERN